MSISQNQRRRGRSGGSGIAAGRESASGSSSGSDALAELRQAVADLDPAAFARCFSAGGWVRVPRPEGDVVLRGPAEIEQFGHDLRGRLVDLSWTPSQRFVAAGQVVEEAVATARTVPQADDRGRIEGAPDGVLRAPMRVVVALDPAGGIGSLTLWINWAALRDPLGVDSAHGAASALVAQARARDARGLRVIESEPGTAPVPLPIPPAPVPVPRSPGPTRPPAAVLWWKQHGSTLAGSTMALAAAAVIGWVAVTTLRPIVDGQPSASGLGASPAASSAVLGAQTGIDGEPTPTAAATTPGKNAVPKITRPKPSAVPEIQLGEKVELQSELLFHTNSFRLTAYAQDKLQVVANRVKDKKMKGNIQVNGYTDNVGRLADNKLLSENRAQAVATALARKLKGLPVEVSVQGFGERQATYDNRTAEGRAKNRKVVIVLPDPRTSTSPSSSGSNPAGQSSDSSRIPDGGGTQPDGQRSR